MTTVYFDLETGGVNDEPTIQLAAVAVSEDWRELGYFEHKIKFDPEACNPEALKLNGYSAEAWKDAIVPAGVAMRFSAWLKPHSTVEMISKRTGAPYNVARLAGYNALTFDLPRLRAMYGQNFFPCSYHVRDVLQRAMFWFDEHPDAQPKPKDLKLSTLCEYFEIPSEGAHEALTDVRMTVSLHRMLAQ
jgi:DNA polymerase III epsilon subunit-like protein